MIVELVLLVVASSVEFVGRRYALDLMVEVDRLECRVRSDVVVIMDFVKMVVVSVTRLVVTVDDGDRREWVVIDFVFLRGASCK